MGGEFTAPSNGIPTRTAIVTRGHADLANGETAADTFTKVGEICTINTGISPLKPIIFCTIPPFHGFADWSQSKDDERVAYNELLRGADGTVINGTKIIVCDFDSVMSENGLMKPEYSDGNGEWNARANDVAASVLYPLVLNEVGAEGEIVNDRVAYWQSTIGKHQVDSSGQFNNSRESPAINGFAITPSDTDDLTSRCDALYVGVTGDVQVTLLEMADGDSIVFAGLLPGWHPISIKRVWAAGTTATGLIGVE